MPLVAQYYLIGFVLVFIGAVIFTIRTGIEDQGEAGFLCIALPLLWPLALVLGTVWGIPTGFTWLITYPARKRTTEREARESSASEHTKKHTKHTYNTHGV